MDQSLRVISQQERMEVWAERIMACRNSGMSVRAWCLDNGLNEKSYFYWQRKLFHTLSQQRVQSTTFAEVTPKMVSGGSVAVSLQINDIGVALHNGADSDTVEAVLPQYHSPKLFWHLPSCRTAGQGTVQDH